MYYSSNDNSADDRFPCRVGSSAHTVLFALKSFVYSRHSTAHLSPLFLRSVIFSDSAVVFRLFAMFGPFLRSRAIPYFCAPDVNFAELSYKTLFPFCAPYSSRFDLIFDVWGKVCWPLGRYLGSWAISKNPNEVDRPAKVRTIASPFPRILETRSEGSLPPPPI